MEQVSGNSRFKGFSLNFSKAVLWAPVPIGSSGHAPLVPPSKYPKLKVPPDCLFELPF